MRISSIQIGKPVTIPAGGSGEWWDKEWTTAFFKNRVSDPQWLAYNGLAEDGQADTKVHGGVDKAMCCYSIEHYPSWKTVIGVDPLEPGAFGENMTLEGLTEEKVRVGDIYQIGEAVVQVSQPREPCWKVSRRWKVKDLTAKIAITGFTGFYFRVLWHGYISEASNITRLEQGNDEWTIARCNQIMHHDKTDLDSARRLSEFPPLSGTWKDALYARVASQTRGF